MLLSNACVVCVRVCVWICMRKYMLILLFYWHYNFSTPKASRAIYHYMAFISTDWLMMFFSGFSFYFSALFLRLTNAV